MYACCGVQVFVTITREDVTMRSWLSDKFLNPLLCFGPFFLGTKLWVCVWNQLISNCPWLWAVCHLVLWVLRFVGTIAVWSPDMWRQVQNSKAVFITLALLSISSVTCSHSSLKTLRPQKHVMNAWSHSQMTELQMLNPQMPRVSCIKCFPLTGQYVEI